MGRRAWMWALLAGSGLAVGCSCHLTSVPDVDEDIKEACAAIAQDSRSRVYIFLLEGCALLDCDGVKGLHATLQSLGFGKAWSGRNCHARAFRKEIACIHHDDPQGRIVLVGHGSGVDAAAELAKVVGAQGVDIELLVGLGRRVPCPSSVFRQLTLLPCGPGGDSKDVYEVQCKSWRDLPSHAETVDILARELFSLAGGIPSESDLPKMYYPEHEPTPRPVMPLEVKKRDGWDFLKPTLVDDRETPATLPLPKKKEKSSTSARLGGS